MPKIKKIAKVLICIPLEQVSWTSIEGIYVIVKT